MAAIPLPVSEHWIDVAHVSRAKLANRGIWHILGAGFIVALAVWTGPRMREDFEIWEQVLMIAVVLLFFWLTLKDGIERLRLAVSGECSFRVGPGGVWFRCGKTEGRLPWEHIRKWYPYQLRVNLMPAKRQILFESIDNSDLCVDTFYFREKQDAIARNIRAALHSNFRKDS